MVILLSANASIPPVATGSYGSVTSTVRMPFVPNARYAILPFTSTSCTKPLSFTRDTITGFCGSDISTITSPALPAARYAKSPARDTLLAGIGNVPIISNPLLVLCSTR